MSIYRLHLPPFSNQRRIWSPRSSNSKIVLSQTSNTSTFWPFSHVYFRFSPILCFCLVTRVHFLIEPKIKNSHAPKISKQGLVLFLTESKPNPRVGCCQCSLWTYSPISCFHCPHCTVHDAVHSWLLCTQDPISAFWPLAVTTLPHPSSLTMSLMCPKSIWKAPFLPSLVPPINSLWHHNTL